MTIQISKELKEELDKRKIYDEDSYEEVIWDLIENTMELSEETKRDIEKAQKDIKEGRVYTLEQVKSKLNL